MRGEETGVMSLCGLYVGSPPHARGRGDGDYHHLDVSRITPACAGKRPCAS